MSKPLPDEMIEATRLTRAGRLIEATALLQRMLRGKRTDEADAAGTAIMLPPPMVDGREQDAPRLDETLLSGNGAPDAAERIAREPRLPKLLSGIFDRFPMASSPQALNRVLKRSPLAPAEVVPSVGDFVAKSFSDGAASRAYKLYIPSRHEGEPRPLIVMLHGCTQSADDFAAGTRMNFAAEEHDCFVAYPEQAITANSSKCWNWFKEGDQQRGQGEPALIAGITRQIMADYNIDARRIYIAGLSAGGAAAVVVAEAYPELYAAVGVHSGLACGVARDLPSAFAAMQGRHPAPGPRPAGPSGKVVHLPTIVFHGDRDATVHPRNGVEVSTRARGGGNLEMQVEHGSAAAGHTYTRSTQRDASGRALIEDWVIHGAGHAWSGGSPSGSFTDPKGPDATKEMLRFFLDHTRASDDPSGV